MWSDLLGWPVIAGIVGALLTVGFGVLSMSPPAFDVGRASLTVAAILLSVESAIWLVGIAAPRQGRIVTAIVIFTVIGVGWVESWRWIGERQRRFAEALEVSKRPTIENPAPTTIVKELPPPVHIPTAEEIASIVAARLPASPQPEYHGPFPPFSLGGSVEEKDFRDVFLTFRDWKPVAKAHDVTIDWHSVGGADLVIDALVKGKHGVCHLGLWDVDNDVVVSESPPIAVDVAGVSVTFPIPREAGRKMRAPLGN